jgi:TP901 family phage tail tape measure protein
VSIIRFTISAIDDFSNTMRDLDAQMRGAFDAAGGIGKALSVAGAVGAAGLGLAAKSAMDFESQLSSIKAVSGATSDEMAKLSDLAEVMGAKTKYSSVEAAQGIEELIKAGVSVTDIIGGGLEGALSLAVAGEIELADAAEIASTALNAFKADGLDVSKAADILAGAANASATSVGELKFGLSMVSAVASGVGMSFAETNTALAVFAQNGLKGSDAGTSLKTMLLNLSPSTEAASEMMGELGLLTKEGNSLFYDATGKIKSLADISELLKTKLSGLTDEQRQMALKTMFGTDAIRAANILYKEGAEGVETMFGAMSKVKAVDVMNERLNNTKGAIEELKGAFETAMIALGKALLPLIKKTAVVLQKLIGWFNGLSDGTKRFIAIGGLVATIFALLLGPILILVSMIPALVAGFTAIAAVFGVTAGALAGILGTFALVAAAVVAVGVALVIAYKKVDWFRKAVDGAWAYLKKSFQTAVAVVKALLDGDFKKAWDLAKTHTVNSIEAIKKFAAEKFAQLKPIILAKLAEWKTAMLGWFDEQKTNIANKLDEWKGAIVDWFVAQKTTVVNKLNEWKTAIVGWFVTQKNVIIGKLNEWKSAIVSWFESLPTVIKEKLAEWGTAIVEWTKSQNAENKRQFDEWKNAIIEWFASIPTTITEKLIEWKNAIVNWFVTTKESIVTKFGEWKSAISDWFASIPGVVKEKLTEWKNAIVEKFTEMKASIKTKLSEWQTSISTWFTSMPGKIRTWFDGWKANMAQKFTETKATIKQKLDEWFATIKGWFTALPNKPEIKNAGQNMVKKMSDGNNEKKKEFMDKLGKIVVDVALGALAFAAVVLVATGREIIKRFIDGIKQINLRETGKDIIRGLISGMSSMISSVAQKAREIAAAAKNTVKKALGIHSPSRVLMELGEFTGQGFVKGIGAMVNDVKGISAEMAGAAVPSNKALGIGASSSAPAQSQAINLTLNYSGTGSREDADGMLEYIERGLNDRLGIKLRMNGVR